MAFFLPSFYQKRLLRYALTHLDFLESEDLDLDNLGFTLGQRSVIELKDVKLRIQKISVILHLPPAFTLDRANIRLLRLTIPADLHISGIVVEIVGVEVSLGLPDGTSQQNSKAAQPRSVTASPRSTKFNRPRISTPPVHDPGGSRGTRRTGWEEPEVHAIPSSHDLAESFLQSEPKEEKDELQAAIAAQSQYVQESVTSTRDNEIGTGAPGGFSLPGFIADFIKGIGDRLEVTIKDVMFTVETKSSLEAQGKDSSTTDVDNVKIMVKMSELVLPGLTAQDGEATARTGKRQIIMQQLRVYCVSDPDAFSQYSQSTAPSSPRLARSKSKPSSDVSTIFNDSFQEPTPKSASPQSTSGLGSSSILRTDMGNSSSPVMDQRLSQQAFVDEFVGNDNMDNSSLFGEYFEADLRDEELSESSSDSLPAFASVAGSEMREPGSISHLSQPKDSLSSPTQSKIGITQEDEVPNVSKNVDNQVHAEILAQAGRIDSSTRNHSIYHDSSEDLAESKIFSHDEAESMYMSAISNDTSSSGSHNTMPGGWKWSDPSPPDATPLLQNKVATNISLPEGPLQEPGFGDQAGELSLEGSGHANVKPSEPTENVENKSTGSDETSLVAKQLLLISRISIWLDLHPHDATSTDPSTTATRYDDRQSSRQEEPVPFLDYSQHSDLSRSAIRVDGPKAGKTGPKAALFDDVAEQDSSQHGLEVEVTDFNAQFDVSVLKLLALAAKEVQSTIAGASDPTTESSGKNSAAQNMAVRIKNLKIQFLEHVPERLVSSSSFSVPDPSVSADNQNEDMLLHLLLSGLDYSTTSTAAGMQQRLSISRMSLVHSTGELLSFLYNIKMQGSVKDIDSLNQDAVLARIRSERDVHQIDLQLKPIYVRLDLVKLDEILSRSGGLSSLLDLGNSIASTSTVRTGVRSPDKSKIRRRTVRFQTVPLETADLDHPQELPGKINARIAGAFVDVVGSTCAVKFQSSAIKTVYRQEGLGVVIDRARIEGPLLPEYPESSDISIRLKTVRIEYLPVPSERDLDRLLTLLTPSKDKYEEDDDIMLETLLRQRRQGGVLRLNVDEIDSSFNGLGYVSDLQSLVAELGKLSTVAKYLPEDDRPGILTFGLVKRLDCRLTPDITLGELRLTADVIEGAHVNVPSLMAAQIVSLKLTRDGKERLLGEVLPSTDLTPATKPPMIMCRFIADEMEPTIKLKLCNACLEYNVPTLIAFMGFNADSKTNLASKEKEDGIHASPAFGASSSSTDSAANLARRAKIAIDIRDSAIGLNPTGMSAKGLLLLTDASLMSSLENAKDNTATVTIKKAHIMVTDKVESLGTALKNADHNLYFDEHDHVQQLCKQGYVSVSTIRSAFAVVKVFGEEQDAEQTVDIELSNKLLELETCADSTQTLISIFSNLSPPTQPSKTSKYRTEVVPIQDMLASFSGDAFVTEPGPETGLRTASDFEIDEDGQEPQDLEYVSEFHPASPDEEADYADRMTESYIESELSDSTTSASGFIAPVNVDESVTAATQEEAMAHSVLDFRENYFVPQSAIGGTAHRWDSSQNTYGLPNDKNIQRSPLKVRVRDVHVIWNLFDGYDWQSTRDTISDAVDEIEAKASARRPRSNSRLSPGAEDEEESVIGDFLFNSIYIGIPANKDPRELANAINHDIDDLASDTGSYATTTTVTGSPARQSSKVRRKKLRLSRSKTHKMTFELEGISADFLAFPSGTGEIESSLDVRVRNLTVFDHLPTSTWRKFATYMHDAGIRETDTNMVHLEILNVKPIADLSASEMILKVTVLPLRLHVDQDALDFMSRFFEFKDDSAPKSPTPSTPPFLQRVEVNAIKLKLDFKPKRVDYGGLRSGRTTEFMNFFVLDRADMVLRRVILYGVSGFDRMGIMLNNIWSPDVRRNQLPGVLAGLAPIRSLVDVGSGVRDLVVIPMREYKKDGRIVRSIQKGAMAFAKTTTKELVNLGAKLALGTQTVLQDAETMLGSGSASDRRAEEDEDEDSQKQISLYADQPIGVVQGLRGAYASLERDLLLARDAIVAVPGEVMASTSASGAARAVLRQTPTIILRPAIGASKAVGQTLLGAGNTLDRDNWRRMEEKYKRH